MVTKKEKQQSADRSGSGAGGKPHTGDNDQKRGGKKASSGGTTKVGVSPAAVSQVDRDVERR